MEWKSIFTLTLFWHTILKNTVKQNIFGENHHLWIYWSVILQSEFHNTVFSIKLMILALRDTFLRDIDYYLLWKTEYNFSKYLILETHLYWKKKEGQGPNHSSVIQFPSYCYHLLASCRKSLLAYCSTKPVYVSGTRSSTRILELRKVNLWSLSKMPQKISILPPVKTNN